MGTFNRWDADADLMEDLGGGWWRAVLALEDGLHQFRYRADGEWFTDFAAHGVEHSKWGMNSVLTLGRARIAA